MDNHQEIIKLRRQGKTHSEIRAVFPGIAKSTLSYQLRSLVLSVKQKDRLTKNINKKLIKAREKALIVQRNKRREYFANIESKNIHLLSFLDKNKDSAKLVLSALHLAEGAKHRAGSIQFGNSDPGIIRLFMKLLRTCYEIDESKFRCTILCRADQDTKKLERFWLEVAGINKGQLYKTRIDARTIGKPSRKLDYKGVCVINYLSAAVYYDLLTLGKMMST